MNEPTPPQVVPRKRSLFRWLLIFGMPLALGVLFLGFCAMPSFVDPLSGQEYQLQILSKALQTYSMNNDGKLPEELADLVPECLGYSQTRALEFTLRKRQAQDWSYFPGFTTADPPDTILAASPSTFSRADGTHKVGWGAFRLVLSLDGTQALLKDSDYQACLKEQQQSGWKTRSRIATNDVWHFLESPVWRVGEDDSTTGNSTSTPRKVPGPAEIQALVRGMQKNDGTRFDAAEALCEMGPSAPGVVQALLSLLGDPEAGYSAAHGLAVMSLRDETIVPALVDIVRPGKNLSPKAPYWAMVALQQIGLNNAKAAIPVVIETLAGDVELRWAAVEALAGAGEDAKAAVPQLIEVAANGKYYDSKWAIITLGRIGPQARDVVPALTKMFDAGHKYRIDIARALWKIDPGQGTKLIPEMIREVESQRNATGPNQGMWNDFFSAVELLGEMGPVAKVAIPALRMQLQGGARFQAAWSLWRIEPTSADLVTPILAEFLEHPAAYDNRLDRLAVRSRWKALAVKVPFDRRAAAAGALWQIHPEKRAELAPVLNTLLREWAKGKVLNTWTADTRALIPALEDLLQKSAPDELRWIILESLQKINTTDPGSR